MSLLTLSSEHAEKGLGLLTEVGLVLLTYGQRLEAIERTLDSVGDDESLALKLQIAEVRQENQRASQRLQQAIEAQQQQEQLLAKDEQLLAKDEPELAADDAKDDDTKSTRSSSSDGGAWCAANGGGVLRALGNVWNTHAMKRLYHPLLKNAFAAAEMCGKWKTRPDILKAMQKHNEDVMGAANVRSHINVFSYPGLVKDHLFNVQNILDKCLREADDAAARQTAAQLEDSSSGDSTDGGAAAAHHKGRRGAAHQQATEAQIVAAARRRFGDLVEWLDREQPTLNKVKGLTTSRLSAELKNVAASELVLRMEKLAMPKCDADDAESADLILSSGGHVVLRCVTGGRVFRKEILEHSSVDRVKLEEGDDERTFHLLGVGLRKVLTACSTEARDDWVHAINELQSLAMRRA